MLTLLKIHLLSYFGINKVIHTKDKKLKSKLVLVALLFVLAFAYLLFMCFLYASFMANALAPMGMMNLLQTSMMSAASFATFITTIYKVDGILFGFKDYDMIMSIPIKTSTVVASRVLMLYVFNTMMMFLLMIPAGIVYAIQMRPPWLFYFAFSVTLLLLPIVPIVLGTIVGAIIAYISSKFRRKNLMNIVVSLVFVGGILVGSQMLARVDTTKIVDLGATMTQNAQKVYPLTALYVEAVHDLNPLAFLAFLLINLVVFGGFCWVVGKYFTQLNSGFASGKTMKNYKLGEMKSNSAVKALFLKEWQRYVSSPIYVLNTSIGAIMLTIMAVGFLIFGGEQVESMLAMPGLSEFFAMLAPIVLSGFVTFVNTTYASISLEGKGLWVVKSFPISTQSIFISKMMVNLVIFIPTILINATIFTYILKPSLLQTALLFVTPLCYVMFSSILGVILNLHFPNFEWSAPVTPVKQSVAMLLCLLITVITVGAPLLLFFYLKLTDATLLVAGTTFVMALLSVALYGYMSTKGKVLWEELS